MNKKVSIMHQMFGTSDGHTCGDCEHLCLARVTKRLAWKCRVYGITNSLATDWSGRYPACGKFTDSPIAEYNGIPVVKQLKKRKEMLDVVPMDGQISLEG